MAQTPGEQPDAAVVDAVFAALPHALLLCTPEGRVQWANAPASQHRLDGMRLGPGAQLWSSGTAPQRREPQRRVIDTADGDRVLLLTPLEDGSDGWLVEIDDPESAKATQAALRRRLEFERTVVAVSAALMRAEGSSLDLCIETCLGAIGQFFAVDRAYLFRIDARADCMSNTHEWVAPGISREAPNLQAVPLRTFPWLMEQLAADRAVVVPRVDELPEAAVAERTEFQREGIRSIVLVPIPSGAGLWGFAGFDAVRGSIDWTEDFELGLRLLGKMLASALQASELAQRLTEMAFHDPLTGLANRKLLEDRLAHAHARARRSGGALAVLLVDIDDFKPINDRLGHGVGDELLCEVARRLCSAVRSVDTVARLGGDEFVLLLDGVDEAEAQRIAGRALAALGQPVELQGESLQVGASVGLAFCRGCDLLPAELLRAADGAMYQAKTGGKNRWAQASLMA